ncbi:MAG: TRAP transporter small permease [Negativicutes bacterium]|nr:TRAP transporter small permease [Negativicutes bacterium]
MKNIHTRINAVVEYMTMAFLLIMTVDVAAIVFARYVLRHTYPWGEEIALLSFVWLGFFSMALAVRDDTHLKITFYDRFLPLRLLALSNKANKLLMLVFCSFGVFLAVKMCFVSRFSNLPGTGWNACVMYLPVLAGCLLTSYYLIIDLIGRKTDGDNRDCHPHH